MAKSLRCRDKSIKTLARSACQGLSSKTMRHCSNACRRFRRSRQYSCASCILGSGHRGCCCICRSSRLSCRDIVSEYHGLFSGRGELSVVSPSSFRSAGAAKGSFSLFHSSCSCGRASSEWLRLIKSSISRRNDGGPRFVAVEMLKALTALRDLTISASISCSTS